MANFFRKLISRRPERIYLDHAATTPLDQDVWRVMREMYQKHYVNPGAMYQEAVIAGEYVQRAREQVAELLSVPAREITFTHGGSESGNLAIQGVIHAWHALHADADMIPEVIVSTIEHASVREALVRLEKRGLIKVVFAPVTADGVLDTEAFKKLLSIRTILVSVMYANNETGVIQPIREVAKLLRHHRKYRSETEYPYFHTDAIQATQYLDMHAARLGADLISMSASKIYGPKTIGALWMRPKLNWEPLIIGGKQESGRRPGTVDVAGVAGMGAAVARVIALREREVGRLRMLQEYFFARIDALAKKSRRAVIINGTRLAVQRLPHNVHVGIEGVLGERLVLELDARGIAVSAVAACVEHSLASHVTLAMYGPDDPRSEYGTIRMTMGRSTTRKHIDRTVTALEEILQKLDQEDALLVAKTRA